MNCLSCIEANHDDDYVNNKEIAEDDNDQEDERIALKQKKIIKNNRAIDKNIRKHRGDDTYIEEKLTKKEDDKKNYETSFYQFVGEEEWSDGKWMSLGDSVNGVAIGFMLFMSYDGIMSIFALFIGCLIPLIAVGAVQLTMLYFLWRDTPAIYEDETAFCAADGEQKFFLLCIMGVFVTYMIPPLIEIGDEWLIVRTANVAFVYDKDTGEATVERLEKGFRWTAHLVVLYEFFIWMSVFLDGIMYILTSKGIGNIIQAAVAIAFIMDIDNVAVFLYGGAAEMNETTRYRCKLPIESKESRSWAFILSTVPAIIATAAGIVYGLYNTYCE